MVSFYYKILSSNFRAKREQHELDASLEELDGDIGLNSIRRSMQYHSLGRTYISRLSEVAFVSRIRQCVKEKMVTWLLRSEFYLMSPRSAVIHSYPYFSPCPFPRHLREIHNMNQHHRVLSLVWICRIFFRLFVPIKLIPHSKLNDYLGDPLCCSNHLCFHPIV
jgi:hypothetical protein